MTPSILVVLGAPLGAALGALAMATWLGAVLAPLDRCSAERARQRSQWPGGPMPASCAPGRSGESPGRSHVA